MLAALAFWIVTGANRGWTKTSVPRVTLDPVTGISGTTYEKKFVPGLDFLGAAAICSALLTAASCLCSNKTKSNQ